MSQSKAANSLGGLGKYTELRQRLTFVVMALIVYRIGSYIPVPGIDPARLAQVMQQQQGTIKRWNFRMQKATGQLAKTHEARRVRREIARVNTVLGQQK